MGKDGVNLKSVTEGTYSSNYGSRVYVMDSEDTYKMFRLKNREFTIDVDVSTLSCGLNGALYFVEMDQKGDYDGQNNKAGAKYGTGYCDAQCPHDIKWMKGEASSLNWDSASDPPVGHHGACCAEMDIWEANRRSTAYTPHPCSEPGLTKCEGTTCGDNAGGERYSGGCRRCCCSDWWSSRRPPRPGRRFWRQEGQEGKERQEGQKAAESQHRLFFVLLIEPLAVNPLTGRLTRAHSEAWVCGSFSTSRLKVLLCCSSGECTVLPNLGNVAHRWDQRAYSSARQSQQKDL